jgi:hypothetical protein
MKWVRGSSFSWWWLCPLLFDCVPEAAADAVRAVAGGLAVVFRSILTFFQSLAS